MWKIKATTNPSFQEMHIMLDWPVETVLAEDGVENWHQPASNVVLDFHGDPMKAKLAVLSDGNHHMALLPALRAFHQTHPDVADIFYITTPPAPIVSLLANGALRLGNLTLSIRPHVFISPPHVLDRLQSEGRISSHQRLASNRGSVLLIRHGNPKGIRGIEDLMREDVRLFISNPQTETVSYQGYRQTLEGMASAQGIEAEEFSQAVFGPNTMYGQCIHHREAPEAVAGGAADAAVVYYHLALRYTRIFTADFDIIPLGGTKDQPKPHPQNRIAHIHMGLVDDGGQWGARLLEFMQTSAVKQIYQQNGLIA